MKKIYKLELSLLEFILLIPFRVFYLNLFLLTKVIDNNEKKAVLYEEMDKLKIEETGFRELVLAKKVKV